MFGDASPSRDFKFEREGEYLERHHYLFQEVMSRDHKRNITKQTLFLLNNKRLWFRTHDKVLHLHYKFDVVCDIASAKHSCTPASTSS